MWTKHTHSECKLVPAEENKISENEVHSKDEATLAAILVDIEEKSE